MSSDAVMSLKNKVLSLSLRRIWEDGWSKMGHNPALPNRCRLVTENRQLIEAGAAISAGSGCWSPKRRPATVHLEANVAHGLRVPLATSDFAPSEPAILCASIGHSIGGMYSVYRS